MLVGVELFYEPLISLVAAEHQGTFVLEENIFYKQLGCESDVHDSLTVVTSETWGDDEKKKILTFVIHIHK